MKDLESIEGASPMQHEILAKQRPGAGDDRGGSEDVLRRDRLAFQQRRAGGDGRDGQDRSQETDKIVLKKRLPNELERVKTALAP